MLLLSVLLLMSQAKGTHLGTWTPPFVARAALPGGAGHGHDRAHILFTWSAVNIWGKRRELISKLIHELSGHSEASRTNINGVTPHLKARSWTWAPSRRQISPLCTSSCSLCSRPPGKWGCWAGNECSENTSGLPVGSSPFGPNPMASHVCWFLMGV